METGDPYEQYLLSEFENCNDFSQGTIAAAGLLQLCEKLQLQDYFSKLNEFLIGDYTSKKISFNEFKSGLLMLLDGMDQDQKSDEELSSESEVSPKSIFENEPRQSLRPEHNEKEVSSSDESIENQKSKTSLFDTDDDISDEEAPKKRTRNNKEKERTLSTDNLDFCIAKKQNDLLSDIQQNSPITLVNANNEVEILINAWSSISKGATDELSRDEVVKVFQCVGLERDSEEAVQCVFEKLGVKQNGKITLQELLNFIKSGDNTSKQDCKSQMTEIVPQQNNISMDCIESSRFLTGASIIEQWECAGVPGAVQLLQNLGYSSSQNIDLASFVTLLTEEIKCLNDEVKSTRHSLDPLSALLQANSVLQVLYIQSLKTSIEHINAEKEKLRNDVTDANQRATLLAQEVDDHHSKLELSSQQQIKLMEQKHAEKIRDITNRAKIEQDSLMAQNMALEQKVKVLEEEDAKNKGSVLQLQLENKFLEQEYRSVVDQLAAVETTKAKLEKDLQNVSMLQQKLAEMESKLSENDIGSLKERIQTLEADNTSLRDRNDELSVEIEELTAKLLNSNLKKKAINSDFASTNNSMEENSSGCAIKRRGDSFGLMDSEEDIEGEGGSPRLGKVRKCSSAKDSVDTTLSLKELEICEKNNENFNKKIISNEELGFSHLEDVFSSRDSSLHHIIPFSEELQQVEESVLKTSDITKKFFNEDTTNTRLQNLKEKLKKFDEPVGKEILSIIEELQQEKNGNNTAQETLKNRCKELENSLELLKIEYEKTEDYWSEKLEEERIFFEEEQKISDKKYSELLDKILEYEALLNSEREQKQRLETIEEKDSFERQVADMEQECSELKNKLADTIKEKEIEVEKLKNEIMSMRHSRDFTDSEVQVYTNKICDKGLQNFRENENIETLKSGKVKTCRQCHNIKLLYQREIKSIREERKRLLEEINHQNQKLSNYSNVVLNGTEKLYIVQLEDKCHSLMVTLRQQQKQTEDILKNTWKQHKTEVGDLKSVLKMTEEKLKRQTKVIQDQLNKLAKTDLLVKDLFVENAYLISSVQKLEEQCQSVSNRCKIQP